MIKQAYRNGLTKVAGGYSWWRPSTWSARKNPLSGVINPAVDKVYSMTPAGKAQKKILKGIQLTPAQEKAAQTAHEWKNTIPTAVVAANPVTLALTHAQKAGKDIADASHTWTGGARTDSELQTNTPLSAESLAYLNAHPNGMSTWDAAKSVFWDAPLQAQYRLRHNNAVVSAYRDAMKAAQNQKDPTKRQYLIDRAQRLLDRQLLSVHTDFEAWFPYLLNNPINALKQKFIGAQLPESTDQAYTIYGAVRTPTHNDLTNPETLQHIQQIKYTIDHIKNRQKQHGPIIDVMSAPDYSQFNPLYYATILNPGKQSLRQAYGGVPSAQLNKYLTQVRDQVDAIYDNAGTAMRANKEQFPWTNLRLPLKIRHMPDNFTPYPKTAPFDTLLQRFDQGPVNGPTRLAGNNILRSAFTGGLFRGNTSGRVGTAFANYVLDPKNLQYLRSLGEGGKNTADYFMKAFGLDTASDPTK